VARFDLSGSYKRLILGTFDWPWPDAKPVCLMTGGARAQFNYITWSRQVQMWYCLHTLVSYHGYTLQCKFNHETVPIVSFCCYPTAKQMMTSGDNHDNKNECYN